MRERQSDGVSLSPLLSLRPFVPPFPPLSPTRSSLHPTPPTLLRPSVQSPTSVPSSSYRPSVTHPVPPSPSVSISPSPYPSISPSLSLSPSISLSLFHLSLPLPPSPSPAPSLSCSISHNASALARGGCTIWMGHVPELVLEVLPMQMDERKEHSSPSLSTVSYPLLNRGVR